MLNYFTINTKTNINVATEFPNKCPICNTSIKPDKIGDFYNPDINFVSLSFMCPACGKTFISHYNYNKEDYEARGPNTFYKINIIDSFPNIPKEIVFDKHINDLSRNFIEIYNQAHFAEIYNLDKIIGISYRKAIEFLIKDFCIHTNPNDSEKISNMSLSQVIQNYITETKLQNLSKASTWLGNDETHYARKFEDKDINDLKSFELIAEDAAELLSSKES